MNDTQKWLTLEDLQKEHQAIEDKVNSLKKWWHDVSELGIPHYYEMGCLLTGLRRQLDTHIRHEQERGFLAPAVAVHAQNPEILEEIRSEHETLLQQLDEIIERLQQKEPDYDSWNEPRDLLEAFFVALHEHEQREKSIMKEVYANSAE